MTTEHVKIFSGSSIIVKGLQNLLEDHKIKYIIKDNFESARLGGHVQHLNSVEVLIRNTDIEKAKPIVDSYRAEINS